MKIPLEWLKDFVEITEPASKIAEQLTVAGTKVESITETGEGTILELEITPNRPDTLSVYGIAREIAALTGSDLKEIDTRLPYLDKNPTETIKLVVKDRKLCPAYTLAVFTNVKIQESPHDIRERLIKSGLRPINSIVDATNYCMLETGQPSHSFDFDKIKGHVMLVRAAKEGEEVTTLDSTKRKLPAGAIIIEDKEKIIDLAGLMGGENSEVDINTTNVALIVPIYNPVSIRRTSQALNLRTEASGLFEKNLDPLMPPTAFYRLAQLIFAGSGGVLSSKIDHYQTQVYQEKVINLRLKKVIDYLGINLEPVDLIEILTPLGFLVKHVPQEAADQFEISVPSYRQDISQPVDLIEEIARIYGYNKFPKTLPSGDLPTHPDSFLPDWENIVKEKLAAFGLNEVMGYTLLSENSLVRLGADLTKTLKITNPNSEDFVYLRPTLLIGLLTSLERNLTNFKDVSLFEIGKVFSPSTKSLPNQDRKLGVITTSDFATLKGFVEALMEELNLKVEFQKKDINHYEKGRAGIIISGKQTLGKSGCLDPKLLANFNIDIPVTYASFDFEALVSLAKPEKNYVQLPKYPEVKEDLSVVVNNEISTQDIISLITKTGKPLLKSVVPFDQFISDKLGMDRKSITFALTYGANKTLTNEEVARIRTKIITSLQKTFHAEIR